MSTTELGLRCDGCGDPVGLDEPAWADHGDGKLRSCPTLRALAQNERHGLRRVWHIGCLLPNAA